MQAQKNTRRKRKDHESRDFTCKCGKSYLSYAAAYTHVKNKHNLEKQFLDQIVKPKRQKLPRGRPRQRKQAQSSTEISQLSVVEQAILKIYQCMSNKFQKLILEGNSKKSVQQVEEAFHKLIDRKLLVSLKSNEKTDLFFNDLTKHFTAQISGKIKLALLIASKTLYQNQSQNKESIIREVVAQLNSYDLWKGQNQVNSIICEAFWKWLELSNQQ